jgi:dihydrolipoamide dehydrogenase
MEATGVTFAKPAIDIDKLRGYKESVIKNMTTGLLAWRKRVRSISCKALVNSSALTTSKSPRQTAAKVVQFKQAIIAAGSSVVNLPFVPEDPRIVDSTGALELRQMPKRMLVIGGGIIGLEMATVYSTLGARIDVVEMMDGLMQGATATWSKSGRSTMKNASTTSC